VELTAQGFSNRNVSSRLGVHHKTVAKLLRKKNKFRIISNLPSSGRQRITDAKTDSRIVRNVSGTNEPRSK